MIKYLQKVRNLASDFSMMDVQQILWVENMRADLLTKLAILGAADLKWSSYMKILEKPSIEEAPIMQADLEPSWIDPILHYLQDDTLPTDRDEAKKLRRLAPQYLVYEEKLYKKSFTLPLLRCIRPSKADYALREMHKWIYGNHLGGKAVAHKILRQGYFWPTMQKDAADLINRCDQCQRTSNIQRRPSTLLAPITMPWSFAQWRMDILGLFFIAIA